MARVEKVGAVLELRFLLLELGEFGFALLQRPMITAPGEDSVRPGDGVARKRPDHDQRERRRRRAAYQLKDPLPSPH